MIWEPERFTPQQLREKIIEQIQATPEFSVNCFTADELWAIVGHFGGTIEPHKQHYRARTMTRGECVEYIAEIVDLEIEEYPTYQFNKEELVQILKAVSDTSTEAEEIGE